MCRPKYRDRGAARREGRRRPREVVVRGPADRHRWGSTRSSPGPRRSGGSTPSRFAEMRPGRVRHPRAGPGHEPQRRARVDVLPDLRRLQRPVLPGGAGQGPRARHACRPTTTGTSTSGARAYPGRFIPLAIAADLGSAGSSPTRCGGSRRRAVAPSPCRSCRTCRGCPATTTSTTGTRSSGRVSEEQVVMCLHIGQGFDAIQMAPDAPIDNIIILATQVSVLAAQDLLWGRRDARSTPTSRSRGRRPGSAGSRSTSTAATGTTRTSAGSATTSATSCRARSSASTRSPATSPTRSSLKVRHDIGIDIIAWECDYPHSDSIWPDAPEVVLAELEQRRRAPTTRSTRSPGRTPAGFFGYDPFKHIPQERDGRRAARAVARRRHDHADACRVA